MTHLWINMFIELYSTKIESPILIRSVMIETTPKVSVFQQNIFFPHLKEALSEITLIHW